MQGQATPIDQQFNSALAAQVAENRVKLYQRICCGRRNFALRGHREDQVSKNPGNFKGLFDKKSA